MSYLTHVSFHHFIISLFLTTERSREDSSSGRSSPNSTNSATSKVATLSTIFEGHGGADAKGMRSDCEIDKKVDKVNVGVERVESVKSVEKCAQMIIDGAQTGFKFFLLVSLTSNLLIFQVATKKRGKQNLSYNKQRTTFCGRALGNGNRLQIRPQIITSHLIFNMKERRNGSVKAKCLRSGRRPVPFFGSTENVCSPYSS